MKKPYNRPAGVGNAFPLARFAGLLPQFGGAAKGKRLNGQARRLTSPHLEVLCRTSTVALWMLSHGAMSLQESIERFILSPDGVAREHDS